MTPFPDPSQTDKWECDDYAQTNTAHTRPHNPKIGRAQISTLPGMATQTKLSPSLGSMPNLSYTSLQREQRFEGRQESALALRPLAGARERALMLASERPHARACACVREAGALLRHDRRQLDGKPPPRSSSLLGAGAVEPASRDWCSWRAILMAMRDARSQCDRSAIAAVYKVRTSAGDIAC